MFKVYHQPTWLLLLLEKCPDIIMADIPSFITTSECTNNFCSNQRYDYNSIRLSVNKYNKEYSIQNELDDYTKDNEKECTYCGCLRNSKSRPTTHILIEINYLCTFR